jgi:holo-[acyl-carrier protein] synthase
MVIGLSTLPRVHDPPGPLSQRTAIAVIRQLGVNFRLRCGTIRPSPRGVHELSGNFALRVGTDVQSVTDVAASLERYGDRYTRRLFTDHELETCGRALEAAPRLAARFAAKEAVIKLLGPTHLVPAWRSIEVRTAADGAPSIALHGEAAELAHERGVGPVAVSLSHGAGIGMATAVSLVITEEGSRG